MGNDLRKVAEKHSVYVPDLDEELVDAYPLVTGGVFIPMSTTTGDLPLCSIPQIVLNAGMDPKQYQDCIYEINHYSIDGYSKVRKAIKKMEKHQAPWETYYNNLEKLINSVEQICYDLNEYILYKYNLIFIPFIHILRDDTNTQHFGIIIDLNNKKKKEMSKKRRKDINSHSKKQKNEKKNISKQDNDKNNQNSKNNDGNNNKISLFSCFCMGRNNNNTDSDDNDDISDNSGNIDNSNVGSGQNVIKLEKRIKSIDSNEINESKIKSENGISNKDCEKDSGSDEWGAERRDIVGLPSPNMSCSSVSLNNNDDNNINDNEIETDLDIARSIDNSVENVTSISGNSNNSNNNNNPLPFGRSRVGSTSYTDSSGSKFGLQIYIPKKLREGVIQTNHDSN